MKFALVSIFLIFSFSLWAQFGKNLDFYLIDVEEYLVKESKGKLNPGRRYVVMPGLTSKREGFDQLESANGSLAFGACISLLDFGKTTEVMSFIGSDNMSSELAVLVEAFRWFAECSYNKTLQLSTSYRGQEYAFLNALLSADCCYQIEKNNETPPNWIRVFEAYQDAYDFADENYQKRLVKHRIKLLRYKL